MEGSVILNTGPLVAYLDSHEEHHDWAVAQIESFDDPMVTCEAVITEACFLLSHHKPALAKVADEEISRCADGARGCLFGEYGGGGSRESGFHGGLGFSCVSAARAEGGSAHLPRLRFCVSSSLITVPGIRGCCWLI